MNLKNRMRVMSVMAIAAMTGLNACSEEQGAATNLATTNQDLIGTAIQQNLAQPISKKEQLSMWMTVNGHRFEVILEDNVTTQALIAQLPLTLYLEELNGNEKHGQLSGTLPTDEKRPGIIHNGDLMLYGNQTLVVFYKTFSSIYSYTQIGKLEQPEELQKVLGSGNVEITFNKD